jgi:hypothetical protein
MTDKWNTIAALLILFVVAFLVKKVSYDFAFSFEVFRICVDTII